MSLSPWLQSCEKIHSLQSLHHLQNMKEMGGHAEETQTNTAMFARQIHEKERGNCKHRYTNSHTESSGNLPFCKLCYRVTLRLVHPKDWEEQSIWLEWKVMSTLKGGLTLYILPGCVTWKRVSQEKVANCKDPKSPNMEQNKERIFFKRG